MARISNYWTPETEAKMAELWEQGLSAGKIAKILGEGFTNNMVIGKSRRMGLTRRPSPIKKTPA